MKRIGMSKMLLMTDGVRGHLTPVTAAPATAGRELANAMVESVARASAAERVARN
jgi:hypothetical protein